ncbi:hypothetical protein [Mesoterricola silvestris]|uniref:NHLP bacteriocin system secretion protein n=1 Tax=Mesoterricola silvestris TaxID=2927979 RepID=A0AA48GV93_9BACT|nr:hypothetical protein [Mesoterricola silvestris]BDU70963.1 hypothetical protein METEAL_01370 [Mesoterricola silvestris]
MEVVNLRAWIALLALAAALLGALAWCIFGSLADEVSGSGILTREGGYFPIRSLSAGILERVLAKPGDRVEIAQSLAALGRPEVDQELVALEREVGTLRAQRDDRVRLLDRETAARGASFREQERQIQEAAAAARERVRNLGGPGAPEPPGGRDLEEAKAALAASDGRMRDLDILRAASAGQGAEKRFQMEQDLRRAQDRLDQLRVRDGMERIVRSPFAGKVMEVLRSPGEEVRPGSTLLKLELDSRPLVGYLLVRGEGHRLRPGMAVHLEPAGFRREEFGAMRGQVTAVSGGPVDVEAVENLLDNRQLAAQLAGAGDAFLVEVKLELDPTTPSGFGWTTRQGPQERFGSGTLLQARFQVRRQAPITLILPALKKWIKG